MRVHALAMMAIAFIITSLPAPALGEYHPALGRFMQRDPLGYVDGGNLYEYVRSNPILGVDFSGLCRVMGPPALLHSGSIAAMDADFQGSPHNQLAEYAHAFLTRHYQGLARTRGLMTFANFDNAGVQTAGSRVAPPDRPAGYYRAGHYLFFVHWNVCEVEGRCHISYHEDATHRYLDPDTHEPFGHPRRSRDPREGQIRAKDEMRRGSPHVPARRIRDDGQWDEYSSTLIYVDAPGREAITMVQQGPRGVPGIDERHGWDLQIVAHFEIKNDSGDVVHRDTLRISQTMHANYHPETNPRGFINRLTLD